MHAEASSDLAAARPRLFALTAVVALVVLGAQLASEGYRAMTDSVVTPTIFSPDDDVVVASKLRASEIVLERAKAQAELEAIHADVAANEASLTRIERLEAQAAAGEGSRNAATRRQPSAEHLRIELETLRLTSERRTKLGAKKVVEDKLRKLDELEGQLRARLVSRAFERSIDVAFVPYSQLDGVGRGAMVYDCVWGLFHCTSVGRVTELVPGEVVQPDRWGGPSRGQYAVLDLSNRESAKAKTLRVRGGAPFGRYVPHAEQAVSVR